MKAHVLYGVNDIRYEDVEKPSPGKDEVLVRVEAVGVCGSDIPRIYETGAHRHPLIPGHEFAGTVCEVGENAETTQLGKRVGIFPLIPCGECSPCKNKQYEMCRNYNYLGSRCDGGFAEYVRVPMWNLIELSDNVSFEDAAMLEPTSVAAHAIRRMFRDKAFNNTRERTSWNADSDNASGRMFQTGDSNNIMNGSSVAVIGLGTIGLLLTMQLMSAVSSDSGNGISEIYVIGNKEFQRKKAYELGVAPEYYCDATKEDPVRWIMEKTGGIGVDCVFECVGKNETISAAVESAAPAGRIMFIGNPASDITFDKNTYWKILRNQLTVMGSWNSSFTGDEDDDWHYVVNRLAAGKLHPSKLISHRLALSELEKGLHIMRDKTEEYVKVMIGSEK